MLCIEDALKKISSQKGFTLSELTITLSITILVFILLLSTYILSQQSFRKSYDKYEIVQNARVFNERLARELRQTPEIVTALAENADSAISEIKFQDGHDTSQIRYINYYKSGSNIRRQELYYYFDSDPLTGVKWNQLDPSGNPPSEMTILHDNLVGEYIDKLLFYGKDKLVNVDSCFLKNNEKIYIHSKITGRNL